MAVRAGHQGPIRPLAGRWRRAGLSFMLGAGLVAGSLALGACQGPVRPAVPGPSQAAALLRVSPADGSRDVKTSAAVVVTPAHAQVISITVTLGGAPVEGVVSEGGMVWHSRWALHTSSTYRVTATGRSTSGKTVRAVSSFRTISPPATMGVHLFQGSQQTYGVGMPIILTFSGPVTRKAAVEAALEVTASKPVVGAWYWDGDQTLYFRPRGYWPQNTQVNLTGHFDGVQAAGGVYGTADLTQDFQIGAALIVSVSTRTHYMKAGHSGRGLPYNASDPALSAWVHNTLTDSFLTAYRVYGAAALPTDRRRPVCPRTDPGGRTAPLACRRPACGGPDGGLRYPRQRKISQIRVVHASSRTPTHRHIHRSCASTQCPGRFEKGPRESFAAPGYGEDRAT
jgi:Bacterial Ig domain/ER-bound oxygenase mpaB/B'/Rubber oxygenase, catalytic domain